MPNLPRAAVRDADLSALAATLDGLSEIDQEALAFRLLDERIRRVVDVLDAYPPLWRIGDGNGGHVYCTLADELRSRGFDPDPPTASGKGKKRQMPFGVRYAVMERDDFTCRGCGARKSLTVDHIVAVTNGGTDDLDNLQTLCRPCNSTKGTR